MNHLLILMTNRLLHQAAKYISIWIKFKLYFTTTNSFPFFLYLFLFFPYRPRHSVPPTHKHTNQPIRKLMSHNLYHHHHHLHQSHQKSIIIDNIYTYMRLIGVFFTDHNKTKTAEKKRGKQDITTKWTIFQCS